MRYLTTCLVIALGLFMLMGGCSKSSNPAGTQKTYLDTYGENVHLVDTAGATYNGDFFPLKVDTVSEYIGSESFLTSYVISGSPSVVDTSSDIQIIGRFEVLPSQMITVSGEMLSLYPAVDYTFSYSTYSPVTDTNRFFMKDTIGVYIKAFKMPNGIYSKVDSPMFIKSKLTAGDSWYAAPRFDLATLLANQTSTDGVVISALNMSAKSKFFVIGKENISLPIGTRNAIRVDQANDISVTGVVLSEGITYNVAMTSQIATVYHLISDTGIVHQNVTGNINIKLTSSGQSSIIINVNIEKCELNLTSIGPPIIAFSTKSSPEGMSLLKSTAKENITQISNALAKAIIKGCSL